MWKLLSVLLIVSCASSDEIPCYANPEKSILLCNTPRVSRPSGPTTYYCPWKTVVVLHPDKNLTIQEICGRGRGRI